MVSLKKKSTVIFWLTRVNMRMAFLSLIGLVVAISMFASISFYNEYITDDFYLDIFEETGIKQIEYDNWAAGSVGLTYQDVESFIDVIENNIIQYELEDVLGMVPFSPAAYLSANTTFGNQMEQRLLSGHYGFDDILLTDCVSNSRLPVYRNEILAIIP